jgi:hypothetical protein
MNHSIGGTNVLTKEGKVNLRAGGRQPPIAGLLPRVRDRYLPTGGAGDARMRDRAKGVPSPLIHEKRTRMSAC